LTNESRTGIIGIRKRGEKMKKTDREILLEILKKAGVKILCEDNADYFEIEPSTYGENVGFDFDLQGNFQKLI